MSQCRLNTLLCGEAGTGKTTLAKQISEALTLPFYYTGSILQKYELIGFIDAGGQYQSTAFRQAYENGGVFLFDELDGSAASALVAFNAALDNGICAFPDAIINKHPDFVCLATANTKGRGANRKYQGRQALDGATLDRYQIVELEYCANIERNNAINEYKRHGGTTPKEATFIIDYIQAARAAAVNLGLNCIISPRATFAACRLLGAGMNKVDALKVSLNNKLSDDERAQIEAAL
jgi:MoxR-like ATPase